MSEEHLHESDESLLLYVDEELSAERRSEVHTHLADCGECRARMKKIHEALAEFDQYRQAVGLQVPPASGPRARLISRLGELRTPSPPNTQDSWIGWVRLSLTPGRQGYVSASLLLVLVLIVAVYRHETKSWQERAAVSPAFWTEPRANLTPGATLPVTKAQVCAASPNARVPDVPVSLQRKVFALYGVSGMPAESYEVDYLITPELGGATDVRNLWPEPYFDTTWNAHVKDQLEERLHQLVCDGDVDLATAQQDISKDWIAAYRKYFHTDKPITANAPLQRI